MTQRTSKESAAFESALLETVAAAFHGRRKAIRSKAKSFSISRETDQSRAELSERLNVDVETLEPKPTQVRLSVWPDGVLWFRACQPTKEGWAFMFAFHGQLMPSEPRELLALFEQTLGLVYGATRAPDCAQVLLTVWRSVAPVVEHAA